MFILIISFFGGIQTAFGHDPPHTCGNSGLICSTSIPELLIAPHKYDDKAVSFAGYIHIVEGGPNTGYWISMYGEGFTLSSSLRLVFPENAPQKNWLENGRFVSVTGLLDVCEGINCNSRLKPFKGRLRIMPYGQTLTNE